ncbi:MAG: hypothetical protein U0136_08830 [Bdellovibrionota bacterium]
MSSSSVVKGALVRNGSLSRSRVRLEVIAKFGFNEVNNERLPRPVADINAHGVLVNTTTGVERPYVRFDDIFSGRANVELLANVGLTAEGWEWNGNEYVCIHGHDENSIRTYKKRRTGACRHAAVILCRCRKSNCWRPEVEQAVES